MAVGTKVPTPALPPPEGGDSGSLGTPWIRVGQQLDDTPHPPPITPRPPTTVSRARNHQGVCPPPGDKGHGGGNGGSLSQSPPAPLSLSRGCIPGGFSPPGGGLGAPPCFGMGIVAPTGVHKPPGKPEGELGEGQPQNTPLSPGWVHPWVLPTFPKCSSCNTLLRARCGPPGAWSPIAVTLGQHWGYQGGDGRGDSARLL